MIKKFTFLILLFLCGCVAGPEYYSHSQNINLEGLSGYTNVFYKNDKLTPELPPENSTDCNKQEYKISRSWNEEEFIIQKKGFKDYHLKLDSVFTSEPWASAKYTDDNKHYFPLLGLLAPIQTAKEIISIPTYFLLSGLSLITLSPIDFTEYITKTGKSIITLPKALLSDIYDIVSVPGTIIINPWREFQYNSVIILEPTNELRQNCIAYNTFISNNGCVSCFDSNIVLYSSSEECAKCPNRYWNNGRCQLK